MTRIFEGPSLVIATHNRGKLSEFRQMFGDVPFALSSAADHGLEAPDETGTTFIENARIKALYTAKAAGLPSLADDSGLCVDVLQGAPGVYSADWAGEKRDFNMAMQKVRDAMLEMLPAKETWETCNRRAHFVSVLVLAWPDGHMEYAEGYARGEIVWPPRGKGGHGFDPVFMPEEDERVYAEMSDCEKNAISHRARAFAAMRAKCFGG